MFRQPGGRLMTELKLRRRVERLLTVAQAAELLGTTDRFPRRLIAERRIRFVRIGRHVRIPESALREFIEAGLVEPVKPPGRPRRAGVMAGTRRFRRGPSSLSPAGVRPATEARTGSVRPARTFAEQDRRRGLAGSPSRRPRFCATSGSIPACGTVPFANYAVAVDRGAAVLKAADRRLYRLAAQSPATGLRRATAE